MYVHVHCIYLCNHVFNPLVIVKGPEDKTTYQEHIAVFTCVTGGGFTGWKVNGTGFTDVSAEVQNDLRTSQESLADSEKRTTLTILARTAYNGTTVQCVTWLGGDIVESENATLTIQGIQSHSMVHVMFT